MVHSNFQVFIFSSNGKKCLSCFYYSHMCGEMLMSSDLFFLHPSISKSSKLPTYSSLPLLFPPVLPHVFLGVLGSVCFLCLPGKVKWSSLCFSLNNAGKLGLVQNNSRTECNVENNNAVGNNDHHCEIPHAYSQNTLTCYIALAIIRPPSCNPGQDSPASLALLAW